MNPETDGNGTDEPEVIDPAVSSGADAADAGPAGSWVDVWDSPLDESTVADALLLFGAAVEANRARRNL